MALADTTGVSKKTDTSSSSPACSSISRESALPLFSTAGTRVQSLALPPVAALLLSRISYRAVDVLLTGEQLFAAVLAGVVFEATSWITGVWVLRM